MNQNHVDDRDAELEALLRATFSSEAQNRLSESRPVPPFPATERIATVHPIRRRWVGLSVVAAALVAVVVGATVLATETMDSQRRPDTPAGTSGAPAPTSIANPSVGPTPLVSTAASTPAAATGKQVVVQGVTLTVPLSWKVGTDPADGSGAVFPATCVGTAPDSGAGCALAVAVGTDAGGAVDVDHPFVTGDGAVCGYETGGSTQRTVTADQVEVDGQSAEHRVFSAACVDGVIEQWTVATAPLVRFVTQGADAAVRAQAAAVVTSAVLPGPRSALRLGDRGWITDVTGDTVRLDRITRVYEPGSFDPVVRNTNPTTYDYPMAADVQIEYDGSGMPFVFTVDELRALAAGQPVAGVPALDTLQAVLVTDGTQVTRVDLYDRT